ncbi:MAG: EcsC family protein [Deltaproteobacteria bacterium]|nr:EcsC family protein [Deltaproteobacteria bacterium]MBW2640128.1 EcsC family protein [Deltaproteobacteria bacterium]MBW2680109.1 EcsC family protein [Deltaproteobacteria bacterium]
MAMSPEDLTDLKYAKSLLENPGFAARIINLIGKPIEKGFELLPEKWSTVVNKAARVSLKKALTVVVTTLGTSGGRSSDIMHKILVSVSGAGGGAFGLPALALELPISTTIMLRSIADIARSEGEDLNDPHVKIECIQVFALGGSSKNDDASETGYFAVRTALARTVSDAAQHIASKGLTRESAPVLLRLISRVSSRFGVVVSEKVAAQAIPLIGAAGGALINSLFIDHFQDVARGHFIIRRLEKRYGENEVRKQYRRV